jgi:AcrR family transcriptional regulator
MPHQKKSDPRAVRSKRVLKEAVISLLSDNPDIAALTVQKITREAELNRATFYLHYEDINDLLKHLVHDIFDDLSQKFLPLLEVEKLKGEDKLLAFLDYFYRHRKLFAVLFEEPRFKSRMHNVLKEFISARRDARELGSKDGLVSLDLLAASLLGIIMWWIKEGTDFSSAYIARQISLLYQK